MKQTWTIGILTLIALLTVGCGSESERMANMAENMIRSQNDVNSNIARANEKFVELNKDLQQERTGIQEERLALNEQFQELEHGRRNLHRERRSELAWSESFRFLAIVVAAIMPLFLCAYLIWLCSKQSVDQEEVNTILIQELASANPRLIQAPNLPAIEHQPPAVTGSAKSKTKESKQEKQPFHTSSKSAPR